MKYKVRKIKKTDLNKLLELHTFLHPEDKKPSKITSLKTWNYILKNKDKYIYFVVETDNKIVSSCNLSIIPNLTRGAKSFGVIENVITHPNYRKMGLGKIVINEAIKTAKKKKCYKIMLLSNSKRIEAHKFYEKIGFNSKAKKGFVYNI